MKKLFKNITSDKMTFRGFLLSLFLLILSVIYLVFYYNNLPPYIPLFNQLPWGQQRIVPTIEIFLPIGIFFLIFVINFIFTSIVYNKNPLIGRIIAATTLLIAIMNLIFIIRTVLIVN